MPKQNIISSNFTTGEVSPLVRGRVDSQKYQNGLETCENFIVRPQGPIWRRSGTKYMGQCKLHDSKSRLVPFEFSDTQGYVVQFGVGYIHFWRGDGQLMETTTTELEAFDVNNASVGGGAFMQIEADDSTPDGIDVPGWGPLSILGGALSNNGTISLDNNGSGLVRVTTSVPHTLRTGAKVYMISSDIAGITLQQFTVTRINTYAVDLQGSSIGAWGGGVAANTVMFSNGVLPGDRIYISGATEYPEISEKYSLVHSQDSWYQFTLNVPYANHGAPSAEEAHIIPIEIHSQYGYGPLRTITGIANNGAGLIRVTSANHGYSTGDVINIYNSANAADGQWTITVISSSTFDLVGSTYIAAGTTGYARKYVGESQLDELRFVQSADVLYILHPDHPVRKLTRLDTDGDRNDWLLSDVDFNDGPYLPLNDLSPNVDSTTPANGARYDDVYLQLSSYSHTATVTSATGWAADSGDPGTDSDDASKYIEYREGDQWRLAQLPATLAAAATTATVTIIDNVLLHIDESTKYRNTVRARTVLGVTGNFTYNAGSPNATPSVPQAGVRNRVDPNNYLIGNTTGAAGTITSNFSNTFGVADVGKFLRYFDSSTPRKPLWAKITSITNGTTANHTGAVSMAANNATGNFVITNHVRTATLNAYRAGSAFSMFASTDVGRHIRFAWGGRWTWGKITAYTSASQVTVTLYEDVPRDPHNAANLAGALDGSETAASTTGRTYDWRLGAWSETTGYPSHACFHEQRLWFGRSDTQPQTLWGSISGDFENMRPTEMDSTVLDDNAVTFTIASTKVNPIKWMVSGPAMTVGTIGGEWQVKAGSAISEPISPSNIVCVPHTTHGSNATVEPIRVGSSILFADRPGRRIRELAYDFSVDGLISKDASYIAEHMLRDGEGAVYSTYQQERNNVLWYVLNDGTLAGLTWNKDVEVAAWHHHTITEGLVESIAVIPSSDGTYDDLYMVVKRTVNGSTKRYVEMLDRDFYPTSASSRTGMHFMDAHVEMTGFSGAVFAGLHHLEAETVTVTIDGVVLGTYTVASGLITIATQTNKTITIGHLYTSTAKSLPPEGASAYGVSQGKIKKIDKYHVRLLNSLALKYGFDANGQTLRETTDLHKTGSSNFFTGTVELIPNNPYDPESQWTLETSKPFPLNILLVTMTVECGE